MDGEKSGGEWPYSIGRIFWANPGAVEQKANSGHLLSLAFAECIHELLQLRCALDLEENLIVVIGDLNVKVLGGRSSAFFVGHDE